MHRIILNNLRAKQFVHKNELRSRAIKMFNKYKVIWQASTNHSEAHKSRL